MKKTAIVFICGACLGAALVGWLVKSNEPAQAPAENSQESDLLRKSLRLVQQENSKLRQLLTRLTSNLKSLQSEPGGAPEDKARIEDRKGSPDAQPRAWTYSVEDFQDLILSGDPNFGDLLSTARIDQVLEEAGSTPELLVAAALLTEDADKKLRYLHEAFESDPNSPDTLQSYIEGLLKYPDYDEFTLELVEKLSSVDPSNGLGPVFAAHIKVRNGDVESAMVDLKEAAARDRLDGRYQPNAVESLYRELGVDDNVATALAAVGVPGDNLLLLRNLTSRATVEARRHFAEGNYDEALALSEASALIGRNLSATGREMVFDLMGLAIEIKALELRRQVNQVLGNQQTVDLIDARIENQRNRQAFLRELGKDYSAALSQLDSTELADYFSRAAAEGESTAAAGLVHNRE